VAATGEEKKARESKSGKPVSNPLAAKEEQEGKDQATRKETTYPKQLSLSGKQGWGRGGSYENDRPAEKTRGDWGEGGEKLTIQISIAPGRRGRSKVHW